MNAFQQLQALVLVGIAVAISPMVMPGLRPYSRTFRLAALVIYLVGAGVILAKWLLTRD